MPHREYTAWVDADWRVYKVEYRHDITEPSFYVFRNDITQADDDVAWAKDYKRAYKQLRGKPLEIHLTAADELGAFVEAQAWLDKRRGKP